MTENNLGNDSPIENIYVNLNPVAVDDFATTDEGQDLNMDLLANDYDPEGDELFLSYAFAENGEVIENSDGSILYTPFDGFHGIDVISYEIEAGNGSYGLAYGQAEILVLEVNYDPTAMTDYVSTTEGQSVAFNALDNDFDPEGDDLFLGMVSAEHGSIEEQSDGTITYTPDAGFTGTDYLTYELEAGNGSYGLAVGTAEIEVLADTVSPEQTQEAAEVVSIENNIALASNLSFEPIQADNNDSETTVVMESTASETSDVVEIVNPQEAVNYETDQFEVENSNNTDIEASVASSEEPIIKQSSELQSPYDIDMEEINEIRDAVNGGDSLSQDDDSDFSDMLMALVAVAMLALGAGFAMV